MMTCPPVLDASVFTRVAYVVAKSCSENAAEAVGAGVAGAGVAGAAEAGAGVAGATVGAVVAVEPLQAATKMNDAASAVHRRVRGLISWYSSLSRAARAAVVAPANDHSRDAPHLGSWRGIRVSLRRRGARTSRPSPRIAVHGPWDPKTDFRGSRPFPPSPLRAYTTSRRVNTPRSRTRCDAAPARAE